MDTAEQCPSYLCRSEHSLALVLKEEKCLIFEILYWCSSQRTFFFFLTKTDLLLFITLHKIFSPQKINTDPLTLYVGSHRKPTVRNAVSDAAHHVTLLPATSTHRCHGTSSQARWAKVIFSGVRLANSFCPLSSTALCSCLFLTPPFPL